MLTRRSWLVYGALFAIWAALIGWQVAEHVNVRRTAQSELINRAKDVSSTLAQLVRSRSFFGVLNTNRLESALKEMVTPGEFHPTSVVLINASFEELVSAGPPIDVERISELSGGALWDNKGQTVMLMNLIDLGTNTGTNTIIVSAPEEIQQPRITNATPATNSDALAPATNAAQPALAVGDTNAASLQNGTNSTGTNAPNRDRNRPRRPRGNPDRPFERPYWMSETEYNTLIQKHGLHGFVVVMPTRSMIATVNSDIWLRVFISILASISVAGYGLAWGNLVKTSELQIRLVRASELNSHLKEMNLAAAGLAHETRNPLNIVRGLAQMISRRDDAPSEVRSRSKEIIDETDRVTAQLNEFINYSRPREVRRAATSLNSVVGEVVRALNYDLEEKKIQLQILADPLTIEADDQLLRQALFNLVLNAIQAVPAGGEIRIRAGRRNGTQAFVEVADNGPGVAPEHRAELFKPYFTTHAEGTGLGLAVVQQIILAHGWEIECLPNQPSGAIFRVTHIKTAAKA